MFDLVRTSLPAEQHEDSAGSTTTILTSGLYRFSTVGDPRDEAASPAQ